jgi:anti-anti-sigma regulatory factor
MNTISDQPGKSFVVLPASCTLKEAASVKAALLQGLEVTGDVELDARALERIDTSGVQLLVAFTRDMREAGRTVTWVGITDELARAARQLGLTVSLGLAA